MSDGFNFGELDDFTTQILEAANDLQSKKTKSFVKKSANKLKTKERKMYEKMGVGLEPTDTKDSEKIKNNFKSGKPYKFEGDDWSCRAFNSAPHAHLVNNGFVHKPHKNQKGKESFVPGYHFIEKAAQEYKPEYESDVEKFVDEFIDNL